VKLAFVTQPGFAVQPPTGSLEIWTWEVARRLASRHEVTIYASRTAATEEATVEGVRYRFLSHGIDVALARVARPAWRLLPPDRPFFASTLYPFAYWLRAGRELRREGFDAAHVFNYSQALPVLAKLAPRTRLLLHMQCEWLAQLDERMLRRRLARAHSILSCSHAVTEKGRSRFPALAGRFGTVFNGVDLEALDSGGEPAPSPHRLLYVGRISPEKGLHVLMDAFAELAATRPDLTLRLVGEEALVPLAMLVELADDPRVQALREFYAGSYSEALLARLPADLRGRVSFAGRLPYAEVARCYRDADVFVLPSLMEAFGMPLAEALAAGVPAVASRTGGIVDIVDDEVSGLLVEPGDAAALTVAIERLLEDRELRGALTEAGRKKSRSTFGWDAIADAFEGQLQAGGHGGARTTVGGEVRSTT
jgi:spore coat protein SA